MVNPEMPYSPISGSFEPNRYSVKDKRTKRQWRFDQSVQLMNWKTAAGTRQTDGAEEQSDVSDASPSDSDILREARELNIVFV